MSRRSAAPPAGRDRAASCRPGRTGRRHRTRERGCRRCARSAAVTTTEGLQRAAQAREVDAGIDVRGVGRADEHGVRGLRRPAREIGGAEIGRVELGAGDLGDAVDRGRRRWRPGSSSSRPGSVCARRSAAPRPQPRRDRLSAMPLAVTHFTNSRREGRMLPPLVNAASRVSSRCHRCTRGQPPMPPVGELRAARRWMRDPAPA